ncbi:MAG: DUF2157 domain-containing protein [Eubacteriales bacterium]
MSKRRLQSDITLLVEKGILSYEKGEEIREFYALEKKSMKSVQILPIMGVFLIGAGLISLCAANWQYIADPIKFVIAFLPLIALTIALYLKRETSSELLVQCLTFGVAFTELFALGIVVNLFQTPVASEYLLQLALIALIPMVYIFHAYWLSLLLVSWAIFAASSGLPLLSLLSLCAFFPFHYLRVREGSSSNLLACVHIVAIFRLVAFVLDDVASMYIVFVLLFVVAILYEDSFFRRTIGKMFAGVLLFLCFGSFDPSSEYSPLILIAMLIGIGFSLWSSWRYYSEEEDLYAALHTLLGSVVLMLMILDLDSGPPGILSTPIMAAAIGGNIYYAFSVRDLKAYNRYSFAFAAFVLAKMASLSSDFMVTGVLFIAVGSFFVWMSMVVAKIMKKEESE